MIGERLSDEEIQEMIDEVLKEIPLVSFPIQISKRVHDVCRRTGMAMANSEQMTSTVL